MVRTSDSGDRRPTQARSDDTVVVEHGDAVGGHPHVAFERGGAEALSQGERLDRVVRRMCPCTAMGECERRVET